MAEWLHEAQYSLAVFTVLIQVTVGALWVLAAADLQLAQAPDAVRARFTRLGSALLVPVAAVGLLFSTTHLGRPLLAIRALRHWESSWMSREIWATGLFFGLIALYTVLWWWRPEAGKARRSIGALGAVVGAATIVTQAMIYLIPGRPMWNHWSTVVLFFGTALTLGPLAVAALHGAVWSGLRSRTRAGDAGPAEAGAVLRTSYRHVGPALLAGSVVYGIGLLARLSHLFGGAAAALATPGAAGKAAVGGETVKTALLLGQQVVAANSPLLWLEISLAVGVPALLGVALWTLSRQGGSLRRCGQLVAAGLGLALLGNLAGRALFYLSGQPWF